MDRIVESQCRINLAAERVFEHSATPFVVGLDCGHIFGQRPLEPDVAVNVAIGQVMHDLSDGPILVARIELFFAQPLHRPMQSGWGRFDLSDEIFALVGARICRGNEGAGWVAGGLESYHETNPLWSCGAFMLEWKWFFRNNIGQLQ
jgi:hypothetical protein